MKQHIQFLLGDDLITIESVSATQTVLNYLRTDAGLMGTKEGCAEGDCGACTVVIGSLVGEEVHYKSVNACILFLATLDGKQLLTVEHLKKKRDVLQSGLHSVQQSFVDHHASQCGFCTPGFVMSSYGHLLNLENDSVYAAQYQDLTDYEMTNKINQVFAGNLCRCTGYGPIIDAGKEITVSTLNSNPSTETEGLRNNAETASKLKAIQQGSLQLKSEGSQFWKPETSAELLQILKDEPDAYILAGGTDLGLWVTKQHRILDKVVAIGDIHELNIIEETDEDITLYAGVTYTQAMPALIKSFPVLEEFLLRHSSNQIRNSGTIIGNIANGSPIGDMPPPLMALGAILVLRSLSGSREVLLEDYFIEYGKQDLLPGEFVEKVIIPKLQENERFSVYKVSKRFEQDISSISMACLFEVEDAQFVFATITFGGMAGTPARAFATEKVLLDQYDQENLMDAVLIALKADFTPFSDFRASREYRMLVAKNLIHKSLLEVLGQTTAVQLMHTGEVRHAN